ncbi:unnamed protein product [Darwinula stevensoni]|uniref:Aldehyde dehydrogenase domain-containing protein n=1 Tax=Darwinula stevensoni TaxID=69355 RepID=A0A7R9A565_9CRUS|nr:unnamed protein product [Darwinula stevensoni]CAG0893764.1 unnamed protein product [Darwinula stevensoni]
MPCTETATVFLRNFINNEFQGNSATYIESFNPSTGKVHVRVPESTAQDVNEAVRAASEAFIKWSQLPIRDRAKYLLKIADLLEVRLEEFAQAESTDQGKPVWLAQSVDIPRAVTNFRQFAEAVPHIMEKSTYQGEFEALSYTRREPIGVAALISPWNLPLYLLTFKIAPAIICGNTVVCKPSEMTSLTAYMLCDVLLEAGLPKGVVNMVFGSGKKAGEHLVTHPDVSLISFTGSTVVGKRISELAAPQMKRLSLELGGKNAGIVFGDVDIDQVIPVLMRSCFINQGEVCLCTSRLFVQNTIFQPFLQKFISSARNLKVGPPGEKSTFLGALISRTHWDKVSHYVNIAGQEGGTIRCGFSVDSLDLPEGFEKGYYFPPTVITDLLDTSTCMQEEIFGPVVCIVPFETEEEVIGRANQVPYGLCASVWARDVSVIHRVANELKVGTVWCNCWMVRSLDMPFGGTKGSGRGREGIHESLHFYTELKTVCVKI